MRHIKKYKQFIKSLEEQAEEIESGVSEQESTTTQTEPTQATVAPTAAPNVESDPSVIAARAELTTVIANRTTKIAAAREALSREIAAQDGLVNLATRKVNDAIAAAAKKPVT